MRAATTGERSWECILVFWTAPPAVVGAEVSDRDGHVVNDAVRGAVSSQEEVRPVLRFAQDVGDAVCVDCFAMVVSVVVVVAVGVAASDHGKHHECVSLRVGFLQMVAAVVPAALQVAFLEGDRTGHGSTDVVHHRACAILGVARLVEPGFGISAAVDAIELEQGVADHGVDTRADDEGRRKLFFDFDAVAGFQGKVAGQLDDVAYTDCSGGGVGRGLVAALVVCRGVGAGLDFPVC